MVSSSVLEFVTLIIGLILPRFLLQAFGSSNNGLVASISQFLNYISVLTIGVAGPTRVALYKTLSKNDMAGTNAVLRATRNFYRKLCKIFLIYIVVLAFTFPFIVESELGWYEVSLLIIIIATGIISEYFFGFTYENLLNADQTSYIFTFIKLGCKVASAFLAIFLINRGASLFAVQLCISMSLAISPIILSMLVKKKYTIDLNVEPDYSALSQRKDAAASSIANIVHARTDIVLLTLFASTAYVSVYSIYMIVMNGLLRLMSVFTGALEAPFGKMYAGHETESLQKGIRLYEFIIYTFVAVVFTTTGFMILPFVSLYTKGVTDVEYIQPLFAILLTAATAMQCIRQPYLTMVQAAGKYKENKVGNFIEAGLNIGLSLALVIPLGLVGVTIGTLVANLFRTILYAVYMSKNLIKRSIREVFMRFIWVIAIVGLSIGLGTVTRYTVRYDTWLEWILSGFVVVAGVGTIAAAMSFLFYKDDIKALFSLMKGLIRKS